MAWPDIIPHIRYEDAPAMLDWLEEAFGFTRRVVDEEGAQNVHAEGTFGTGLFMCGSPREGPDAAKPPKQVGGQPTGGVYAAVGAPDAPLGRARAPGGGRA